MHVSVNLLFGVWPPCCATPSPSSSRRAYTPYSYFEKGCPTKPYATMLKGIMGNRGFRCFSDIEGNSTNKCIHTFSFLVDKHRELQSINAKLFLPIIPIGIVAYAFTLLWDNLCRNSRIPLAMMRKSTHGFPFLSHMSMGLRLAALRAAGPPL